MIEDPNILKKRCTKCGRNKVRRLFHNKKRPVRKDGTFKVGLSNICKRCQRNGKTPIGNKNVHFRWRYNIEFSELWNKQAGLCAACKKPMLKLGKSLLSASCDHDHTCCPGKKSCGGCVRGLVHIQCNKVLGNANDDPVLLRQLATYVEKNVILWG